MRIPLTTGLLLGAMALSLSACGSDKTLPPAASSSPAAGSAMAPSPSASHDPEAQRMAIMAAAEPFENLTEQAQGASTTKLASLIAKANQAASAVSPSLGNAQQSELDKNLADIQAANQGNDRTGIALAAVEGYRTLVQAAPDTGSVPHAVSLLDYSGFRYQADLAANPVRWEDALAAYAYGDGQWSSLKAKVDDKGLAREFTAALDAMNKAAARKDAPEARVAVTNELDLVDRLESYFNHHAGD